MWLFARGIISIFFPLKSSIYMSWSPMAMDTSIFSWQELWSSSCSWSYFPPHIVMIPRTQWWRPAPGQPDFLRMGSHEQTDFIEILGIKWEGELIHGMVGISYPNMWVIFRPPMGLKNKMGCGWGTICKHGGLLGCNGDALVRKARGPRRRPRSPADIRIDYAGDEGAVPTMIQKFQLLSYYSLVAVFLLILCC